jgi:hypothetical protein
MSLFHGKSAYFQEISEFLLSEVKVRALCVVSGVEHKLGSRPSSVTHASLQLSHCISISGQEMP